MVRVAVAGAASTAGSQSSSVESTMEFAFTDDNLPTIRLSAGRIKETIA